MGGGYSHGHFGKVLIVWTQTKPETIAEAAKELRVWLDDAGPSIKRDIMAGMRWSSRKLQNVLASQPAWLSVPKIVRNGGSVSVFYAVESKHILGECETCGRKNFHPSLAGVGLCYRCNRKQKKLDEHWSEEDLACIDPHEPCEAPPGSELKQMTLCKRYACRIENIWNPLDKLDQDTGEQPDIADEIDEEDWD